MTVSVSKIFFSFIILLILLNLIVLNVYLFRILPEENARKENLLSLSNNTLPTTEVCGQNCQLYINNQFDALKASLESTPSSLRPTPVSSKSPTPLPAIRLLETYVPLGGGKTTNDQWEDVKGTESYINTESYPSITTVYFEASLHIPTKNGKVFARLYNVTDNHPVWNSELSTENEISTFMGSPALTLDSGNKLYRVQLKTSLKYESILSFSRVKLITSF